jgi:hypothetical protein
MYAASGPASAVRDTKDPKSALDLPTPSGDLEITTQIAFDKTMIDMACTQAGTATWDTEEIECAFFEALPTSDPNLFTCGRQISNPVVMRLKK